MEITLELMLWSSRSSVQGSVAEPLKLKLNKYFDGWKSDQEAIWKKNPSKGFEDPPFPTPCQSFSQILKIRRLWEQKNTTIGPLKNIYIFVYFSLANSDPKTVA